MALIGLLPGTFDPIHLGHLALARAARMAGGLDEVWVLVDGQPVNKLNVMSYAQRFRMAELATADEKVVSATAVPLHLRRLPHTMAGFARLMTERWRDRFVFIVGLDTMNRLDSWEEYEQVVKHAAFLVAHRPDVPVETVAALRRRLGPLGECLDVRLFAFEDYTEASSTVVRRELRAHRHSEMARRPPMLAPAVYDYIREQGLYR